MRTLLIVSIFFCTICHASEQERAMRAIVKACMKTTTGRKLRKTAEKKTLQFVGLEKDHLVYFIPLIPMIQGKVSTRRIKGMNLGGDSFNLRPNADYDIRTGQFRGTMDFSIDF